MQPIMMRRILFQLLTSRIPSLVWTLFIFILLALPGQMLPSETGMTIPYLDKYVHFVLFGTFVFLWAFYRAARKGEIKTLRIFNIFIVSCLYGIAMEYIQKYFIPNRDFDVNDILADILGAFGGFLVCVFLLKNKKIIQRIQTSTHKI